MTAALGRLMIQPRTILLIPHYAALPVTVPGPNSDPQDTCVVETGSNSQLTMIIVASCLRIRAWIGLPRWLLMRCEYSEGTHTGCLKASPFGCKTPYMCQSNSEVSGCNSGSAYFSAGLKGLTDVDRFPGARLPSGLL